MSRRLVQLRRRVLQRTQTWGDDHRGWRRQAWPKDAFEALVGIASAAVRRPSQKRLAVWQRQLNRGKR